MDANTFVTLLIAGLVVFFFVKDRLKRMFRHGTPEAEATGFAQAVEAATPNAPIPTRAWLNHVNTQPDLVPHVAVAGPSGSGKTTLVTALLADRQGQIIVLTAKEGDHWGGLPYVGIDLDATYTTMRQMFKEL